jgi:hypothetical protein
MQTTSMTASLVTTFLTCSSNWCTRVNQLQ